MAQFPSLDLLSEIDELALYTDGKGVENNFNILNDEDLDFSCDPPTNGMLFGDDSMLAVDSSNNLLMDDPLFHMFDHHNELLSPQPASPGFNPETLIPVSLPADSTKHHVDDVPAQPEVETSEELICVDAEKDTRPSSFGVDKDSVGERLGPTGVSSLPVRILVNTQNTRPEAIKKMVAPVILPKPAHNLVKIPKAVPSAPILRLKRIHTGEKLAPEVSEERQRSHTNTQEKRCERPTLVRKRQSESSDVPPPSPSNASDDSSDQEGTPFWSLRSRHSSVSSVTSQSSALKRKAYELDPLGDPRMERCRKNAVNAKKNRELKKAHMAELERKVENVSRERDQLAGENESLREAKLKLEQQVKHLNNILKNQSQLSALIGKLSPTSVVLGDLSTSENEDEIISSASGR